MKDDIKKICEKEKTKESCGIILFAKNRFRVRECNNISEFPEQQFEISFFDHCECIKEGEIVGIYHSHITENEEFSDLDKEISDEMMLPFILYSLKSKKFNTYIPEKINSKRAKNFSKKIKHYIV